MAKKTDVDFSIASLSNLSEKKLNEIANKVISSKQGASALKSMMRSVVRSSLKSTIKSIQRLPKQ
jgi:hypothetical protein